MEGKNDLIKLFAERFGEHEVPAPDGAWEAISSQLTLSAAASADHVGELFRERFAGHTVEVDPGVWTNISGQLGHGAAAAGWGAVAAWAGAGVAALVFTGAVVWLTQDPTSSASTAPVAEVKQEQPVANQVQPDAAAMPTIEVPAAATPAVASERATDPARMSQPAEVPNETAPANPAERIINNMISEANAEPLMPVETAADPRLIEEERAIEPPPVLGMEPTPPMKSEPDPPATGGGDHSDSNTIDQTTSVAEEPEIKSFTLFLPNVFTPNGDGANDQYKPEGEGFSEVKIRVYSLANNQQEVFSANELRGWDGTYFNGGQLCPEGLYMVAVEVVDANGKAHAEGQVVNLLR